ncbi:CotH kinase family protein [bacterium]|nr:CotH kinase family protein [bacterium]
MKQLTNVIALSFLTIGLFSCENEPVTTEELIVEIPIEIKLPQVFINTNGAEIVDEPKINADMTVIVNDEIDYTGAIGIEIRGSSSQMFPKKQFGFETRDASNEDMDVSLLGFPEEEDWILYAPYSDKSLMRNILMYDLSREIGRYASRAKFVDVTINESYNGVYLLFEKLKRDVNRIDINKLKDDENDGENLTGGYILKIDKAGGSDETLYTSTNSIASVYAPNNSSSGQEIHFLYDSPDEEDITAEQRTYISNYLASFENALSSSDFTDPTSGYNSYIDTQSFIDFFLLNELSNNVDGYRLSTWLVKDKNEKLKMGPIWDFNLAFGNANYCSGGETNVWAYKFNERCSGDIWQIPFWWDRFLEDPAFVLQLKTRWLELRGNQLSNTAIFEKIDTYLETLMVSNSIEENFEKWPVLGQYIWPNNFVGNTYTEEKDYLVNWIDNRLSWLDSEISGL